MTLGNVIISNQAQVTGGLLDHEESHATQSAILGNDLYALTWLTGLQMSMKYDSERFAQMGGGGCLSAIELSAATGGQL